MRTPTRSRICLVTSTHVCSNPRLVKEADALAGAGYDVTVVGTQTLPHLTVWDDDLGRNADWKFFPVNVERGKNPLRAQTLRIQRAVSARAPRFLWSIGLAATASSPSGSLLAREVFRHPAELFVGHNLGALPVAARAAKRFRAKLGFDAEDFHSGELPETRENSLTIARARWLEREYIPRCDYLTASSRGIAKAYAGLCGVAEPVTVLNVFPRAEAPSAPTPSTWRPGPSLYWFSQTVGPDRGLEDAVRALGAMRVKAWLCLRGTPASGYWDVLMDLAAQTGVGDRLRLLPPAPPERMLRLAACHDVGLALEQRVSPNREICVTNKLFTFLAAGIPFAATATAAQSEVCGRLGAAAGLYEPGDWRGLARVLDRFLEEPDSLQRRREAAWSLGRERYNWDREKEILLGVVSSVLRGDWQAGMSEAKFPA